MIDGEESSEGPEQRVIAMAARATVELFGNGAIAKTKERLNEVETDGDLTAMAYWQAILEEVTRLHKRRHEY